MTIVIGPISLGDWRTIGQLKRSVDYYREKNQPKFAEALEMEADLYKQILGKYLPANDNQPQKAAA